MLLLLSVVGIQTKFYLQKRSVRSEMKRRIKKGVPKDELYTFTFENGKKPDWTRVDKEFKVENHLYDVVDVREGDNAIVYECVSDDQETFLFANLGEQVSRTLGDEKTPTGKAISATLELTGLNTVPVVDPVVHSILTESKDYFLYSFNSNSCDLQEIGVPPEFL